jgi:serine/threonine-protein kinase HipA
MGALEFSPAMLNKHDTAVSVEVSELVGLVQNIMSHHGNLETQFTDSEKENSDAIFDILRVGTSAGGARAKAVIAMDENGNVKSGQAEAPQGYDYWLLKFDGVDDIELGESQDYGRIEYAYYLMAQAAGINMTECKLLEEKGRAHFMTKRFDRANGVKQHMQTLCGLAHFDFNMAGAYSYEQAFTIMRQLRLSKLDAAEQYRRMVFNVVARNQDDHTKNISFLMNQTGQWSLSPAYDVTYSHNPVGQWTNQHQMSVNGKRDNFALNDLIQIGESISLSKPEKIINEVVTAVNQWNGYAKDAGVQNKVILDVSQHHRINM